MVRTIMAPASHQPARLSWAAASAALVSLTVPSTSSSSATVFAAARQAPKRKHRTPTDYTDDAGGADMQTDETEGQRLHVAVGASSGDLSMEIDSDASISVLEKLAPAGTSPEVVEGNSDSTEAGHRGSVQFVKNILDRVQSSLSTSSEADRVPSAVDRVRPRPFEIDTNLLDDEEDAEGVVASAGPLIRCAKEHSATCPQLDALEIQYESRIEKLEFEHQKAIRNLQQKQQLDILNRQQEVGRCMRRIDEVERDWIVPDALVRDWLGKAFGQGFDVNIVPSTNLAASGFPFLEVTSDNREKILGKGNMEQMKNRVLHVNVAVGKRVPQSSVIPYSIIFEQPGKFVTGEEVTQDERRHRNKMALIYDPLSWDNQLRLLQKSSENERLFVRMCRHNYNFQDEQDARKRFTTAETGEISESIKQDTRAVAALFSIDADSSSSVSGGTTQQASITVKEFEEGIRGSGSGSLKKREVRVGRSDIMSPYDSRTHKTDIKNVADMVAYLKEYTYYMRYSRLFARPTEDFVMKFRVACDAKVVDDESADAFATYRIVEIMLRFENRRDIPPAAYEAEYKARAPLLVVQSDESYSTDDSYSEEDPESWSSDGEV
ncbi:unnamed protein product [Amoebophrya sp. A25]|nr:unnamed protein product [Amoebophrya sp. A25]|eukprot:GSA25T00002922001.1